MQPELLFFSPTGADSLLLSLFIIFAAAKLSAEFFERIRQPPVVGEILAGIIIGPSVFKLIHHTELTHALSEMGVMLLLFTVGLEVNSRALFRVGTISLLVAVCGVVLPFIAGYFFMHYTGGNTAEAIFLGAALVATSVGITARVLSGMRMLSAKSSQIILGAAVIDDILGLLVLSIVTSIAKGQIKYGEILTTAAVSIGFTLFVALVGTKIVKRASPSLERLRIGHAYFVGGLILCLGFSVLATYIGMAAIVGAFLAGMALAEISEHTTMHNQTSAVMEFLVPFFFVGIGLQVDLSVFTDKQMVIMSLILTTIAIATKLLGCGAAALPLGLRAALQIGVGMMPRGEVGIIVAQLGLGMGVLSKASYAMVVFMAVATTLIAPPLLKLLYDERDKAASTSPESEIVEPEQPLSSM
ncbi:MAG: cation:proton antiporter [Acidobacteriota bacterium]|nr:cation:proton antiporter [Blastocatellia bacterium]MDW8412568.1 cation:proton antiporter [Acidobacteriota bacterium]